MKDWKAEYDKLRGENAELRKIIEYDRQQREKQWAEESEFRNTFKQLLINTLGSGA